MRKRFFPYLLANFPSEAAFADIFDTTVRYADAIEVGIPFSDPVADGPLLQEASRSVLQSGFHVESVFRFLESRISECRARGVSIALMTYANPVWAYGRGEFLKACRQSGIRSLIVPDVPLEESTEWKREANDAGLAWVQFVSLVTGPERLRRIAGAAEGFVYLVSVTGITGADIRGSEAIRQKARDIRKHTDVPVALGFGVKSPADIRAYRSDVDAFIVGSRIVECIRQGLPLEGVYREFKAAVEES